MFYFLINVLHHFFLHFSGSFSNGSIPGVVPSSREVNTWQFCCCHRNSKSNQTGMPLILLIIIINQFLIWVYPRKGGWPDLPHSNSNLSNSHSPCRSIQCILLLQTDTLALLLHLYLPRLLWSSSLPLALHFKLQYFSQNMLIIPPQHIPVSSHSICLCHLNHCFLQYKFKVLSSKVSSI